MNAIGQIAGTVTVNVTISHAAIYRNGKVIDLGALLNPALSSEADFINLLGEVVLFVVIPPPIPERRIAKRDNGP